MAGYCTSVRPYFHEPQASENTAQECNIQPYCLLTHQIIDLLYTTLIQQHLEDRQLLRMRSAKVVVHAYLMSVMLLACFQLWTAPAAYRSIYQWKEVQLIHYFSRGYEYIPIKAHIGVATQHMPCELSNMDNQI